MQLISSLKQWVNDNEEQILDTYARLHDLAEVSWKEENTKKYLCSKLSDLGFSYQMFENHHAVVVDWKSETGDGPSPTIGLRADMDALWQNVDGVWKANHSCGHDAHMTVVLHTLQCLKEIGFIPEDINLKLIFQPAEESGKGAMKMIEEMILEDVDYLFGLHVRPEMEMSFGEASPAIHHGATTLLKGRLKGLQAHGSRPNYGINVVDSLGAIISAVNAVKVDPTIASSVKVTQVKAGGDNVNIIPDEAEFGIDVRAQTNEEMETLLEKVMIAVEYAAKANGSEVEVEVAAKMVAAIPNPTMEKIVAEAIVDALGEDALVSPPVTPGGEDFHFYPKNKSDIQATMVGLGTGLTPGLHHPNMEFNLSSLKNGVAILAASMIKLSEQIKTKFQKTEHPEKG
ncbi:M20 peptidase aminoacylase family protein [Alkalihalobacillus sp. TS-13]|uniref:M20 peptidase aminoacylase family protein n=1 Tax=Alkalihalobacillus sp. TS-13 TaxID=2842455 RepID=UPI001C86BF7C|nr:M20 peptidase aminoacylase family protein [Alkalihalobacillus sp. TS-13]